MLYYHSDHLGSSNVISDENGEQESYYEYTPYGSFVEAVSDQQSGINHYFTGKELDSSGLYYYGARYYDPELGRFITPDPIIQDIYDPQALNPYAYCRNNPLNLVDPTGNYSQDSFGSGLRDYSNNLYNWYTDYNKGFQQDWKNFLTPKFQQSTFATNLVQSAWQEANTWNNAFNIGLNYGGNIIAPPGSLAYNIMEPISNTLAQPGYNYGMWKEKGDVSIF